MQNRLKEALIVFGKGGWWSGAALLRAMGGDAVWRGDAPQQSSIHSSIYQGFAKGTRLGLESKGLWVRGNCLLVSSQHFLAL